MGGLKEKTKSIWQLLRTQWSTVRKRLTLISQMRRHTDTWRRSHDLFESIPVSAPDASRVFRQRELQTLRYIWCSHVPQKHIPKSPNKDMGIMKWIRGRTRLQLQPTDDLLGGETLGTAVLSHPLSPNIMEHDLQPQYGLSQRAAAPLRPCPDSQVWTDISGAVSRQISQGQPCQGAGARLKPGCPMC